MGYSCTSPLYRVPLGTSNFRLLSSVDQKKLKNGGVILPISTIDFYKSSVSGWNQNDVQVLRCSQCASCRLARSFDWAVRCTLEASLHEHNYFITLTYDDFNLPKGEFIDYSYEVYNSNLVRRDIQLFIKNLREWERKRGNEHIKVFYCGEYGNLTSRPHFHLVVFGASEIPDLTFGFKKGSYTFYKSKIYEGFWSVKVPGVKTKCLRGFVDISEASFDTMAYTARYIFKKQGGVMKKDFFEYYEGLDPEIRPAIRLQPFIGMSLKPGIASEYYEQHKYEIYSEDLVKIQHKFKVFRKRPPRYYDKLFDREEPKLSATVRRKRKEAGLRYRLAKSSLYNESEYDRLSREADLIESKVKKYVRGL